MSIRLSSHLLPLGLLLIMSLPVGAAGVDDVDERLYRVQLSFAQKGDARAQYFLGEMHEQGLGTKQDVKEAFKWYEKAAERGDVLAKRKLTMRKDIEENIRKDQAIETLKSAPAAPAVKPGKAAHAAPSASKPKAADVVAQEKAQSDEAKHQAEIKAAERDKRRAAVRAMILDRLRHPVGEPFE